jgi:hypothetical protein
MSERVFSQKENDVNLPKIMNEGKIFLANLAHGELGKDYSSFLGSVLMQGIVEAAFARVKQSPQDRRVHHLFVDEFQEFLDAPFADILSQTGKYRLALTMSHQYLGQLNRSPGLKDAIFANATTLIAFRIYVEDAATMCKTMTAKQDMFRFSKSGTLMSFEEMRESMRNLLQSAYQSYKKRPQLSVDKSIPYAMQPRQRAHLAFLGQTTIPQSDVFATNVCRGIERALELLDNPALTPTAFMEIISDGVFAKDKVLQELFDDKRFSHGADILPKIYYHERQFPTPQDFLTLPRFRAFSVVDSADNVTKFETFEAVHSDPAIANTIHDANKQRAEERAKTTPPPSPATSDDISEDDSFDEDRWQE